MLLSYLLSSEVLRSQTTAKTNLYSTVLKLQFEFVRKSHEKLILFVACLRSS